MGLQMATNLSNFYLNLIESFKSGNKGLCNLKDCLQSKACAFFVVGVQYTSAEGTPLKSLELMGFDYRY